MRIYISADMEGVNGVVLREHIDPSCKEYDIARQWMTAEVNAAVEGAVAAGATDVVVNDSHHHMANLLVDKLHPAARLVCGPGKPFSMVQDLDDSFAAAFFIGYHAKFGTPTAVQDHIFAYSQYHGVWINTIAVGELGLNAGMAGHFGVPVALVSGDKAVCEEARALNKKIHTVAVKEGRGRHNALCYPFTQTVAAIRAESEKAARNAKTIAPVRFDPPLILKVQFQKVELADYASLLPSSKRMDAFTLCCEVDDYAQLYRSFLAFTKLGRV
ncbi:M55 family metallopeptidase [candidate division KSB1 bacterium]|nr:M55 family metallopeptidase [candidate division KSB1 bacterium]